MSPASCSHASVPSGSNVHPCTCPRHPAKSLPLNIGTKPSSALSAPISAALNRHPTIVISTHLIMVPPLLPRLHVRLPKPVLHVNREHDRRAQLEEIHHRISL